MANSIAFDIIARDKASKTFRDVGSSADGMGSKFAKVGIFAAKAGVALGAVAATAGIFAYKVGADYVGSLNKIQALTGANDATMQRTAKTLESNAGLYAKMGQTTGDAAGGVVELTKAGLSLRDSLKAVNATMVLAKAGEMSVADASTLVANSLNTFHLRASAAAKIANELANAANISSADVSDLAESFKYVSPLAAKAGISVGQVSAILAELSNSGVKASQAGTSLRGMLLALQAPSTAGDAVLSDLGVTIYDSSGKMRDFTDIIGDLHTSMGKLGDSARNNDLKKLFGKNAITGASVLIDGGTKALDRYTKGVDKAGAAAALANAKSKGLAGTLAMLRAGVISQTQAFYRQFSPAVNDGLLHLIAFAGTIRTRALPVLAELRDKFRQFSAWVENQAAPAVAKFDRQIERNLAPSMRALGKAIRDDTPALKEFTHQLSVSAPPLVKLTAKVLLLAQAATGRGQVAVIRLGGALAKVGLVQSTIMIRGISAVVGTLGRLPYAAGRASAGSIAAFGRLVQAADAMPQRIRSAVGNLGSLLFSAGQQVVQGLINGIESMAGGLLSKAASLGSRVSGAFKGALGIHSPSRVFFGHGVNIMQGLVKGIEKGFVPVQFALSKVTDYVRAQGDKLRGLMSAKADFASGFQSFTSSAFSTDLSKTTTDAQGNDVTTPASISDILSYQRDQAAKAKRLRSDVRRLHKLGLSDSLIRQLQASGESGMAQIHTLAGGTRADIRQLNAANAATTGALSGAGGIAAGQLYNARIRDAQRDERLAKAVARELRDVLRDAGKGEELVIRDANGDWLIRAIRKEKRKKGEKSAV